MPKPSGRRLGAGAAALVLCLLAVPAAAESERLVYTLMLGGLHVGDAMVTLEQTDSSYRTQLKMNATGALKMVKDVNATMTGEGFLTHNSPLTPVPTTYKREWSAGNIGETLDLTFDPTTRIATAEDRVFNPVTGAALTHEDLPWNGKRSKHLPVPAQMRTNVFDPMTAFLAGRLQLMEGGLAPRSFRIPVYDGTRRYDIVGKSLPVRTVNIGGKDQDLLPVVGKLEPVFGFSDESKERLAKIDAKIYFTPDKRFLPVQGVVSGELFNTVMNLAADCRSEPTACEAFEKTPEQKAQVP